MIELDSKKYKVIKSIEIDGYIFSFYGFKYGILYSTDNEGILPYYFDNMRNALNYAYEYGGIKRSLGI